MSYDEQHCANCCDKDGERVIQIMPGGGWMVEYEQPGGSIYVQPVVAWGLDSLGFVRPYDLGDGSLDRVDIAAGIRVYHPKQEDRPKRTDA